MTRKPSFKPLLLFLATVTAFVALFSTSTAYASVMIRVDASGSVARMKIQSDYCQATCDLSFSGGQYEIALDVPEKEFWFFTTELVVDWTNGMQTVVPFRVYSEAQTLEFELEQPRRLSSCRARPSRDEPLIIGGSLTRIFSRISSIDEILERRDGDSLPECGSTNAYWMRYHLFHNALRAKEQDQKRALRISSGAISTLSVIDKTASNSHRRNQIGDDVDFVINYISSLDGSGDSDLQCALLKKIRAELLRAQRPEIVRNRGLERDLAVYCGPRWRTNSTGANRSIELDLS